MTDHYGRHEYDTWNIKIVYMYNDNVYYSSHWAKKKGTIMNMRNAIARGPHPMAVPSI